MCMGHVLMTYDHGEQHADHAAGAERTAPAEPVIRRACAHCGFPIQAGFAYCPNCGMRTATCPSCEKAVDPAWKVCPYCATVLSAGYSEAGEHASSKR